jgi:threonine/homoserine/homoserine lactone efflux protein
LISTIFTAFVLGLFAGLAPGPYTTMVAGTALERGFRAAFLLALTPLLTDVPPMLFSALLLDRLGWRALTALGMVGGTVILLVGIRFLRKHWSVEGSILPPGASDTGTHQSASVAHVALGSLTNPAPWVFWLAAASPLLLQAWNRSRGEGVVFVAVLFATNISSAIALAWFASHSRRFLHARLQRRVLQAVGGTLILAGLFLLWQAYTGDFQVLVDQQESIRSVVDGGFPAG